MKVSRIGGLLVRVATPLAALAPLVRANVLLVPKSFGTLQQAVSAAQPGDTVLVSSGAYSGDVSIADSSQIVVQGKGNVRVLDTDPMAIYVTSFDLPGQNSVDVSNQFDTQSP